AEDSAAMPLLPPAADSAARVLVVDDEAEIADLMRAFLEAAGHEVASAESGAVALELLAEARFDAIVSDLRMPDMDGAALWRAVKAGWPALARRMLFVTGDTLSRDADSFLSETGCPSLDKPFSRVDLVERVRELLSA
ncbi:MAG: response regulator, partial [Rubrivivax sp.]